MQKIAKKGRGAAIWAYITFVGLIIAYFINNEGKNPFASFHIRQALGLHVLFFMFGTLVSPFNSWFISAPFLVFELVLLGYGILGAIQGETNLVPFLGEKFQTWFKTIS